jgi:hypothetical protein
MKKILIATIILCFSLSPIHAEDFETTHTFAAGDIISADMMNELFEYIEDSNKTITAADIVGNYSCTSRNIFLTNASYSSCKTYNGDEGLYITQSGTITFSADGDGTHTYTTGSVNFLGCYYTNAISTYPFVIRNNVMFTSINRPEPSNSAYIRTEIALERVSATRFLMTHKDPSGGSGSQHVECDKTATPPTNPTAFAIATTGLSNVLTWTDNSSDETGFNVYKRTSSVNSDGGTVYGSWVLINSGAGLTVNANIVTYTDTVSAAGDYWYRVKANNVNNGDSVGSKVIKTTNTN